MTHITLKSAILIGVLALATIVAEASSARIVPVPTRPGSGGSGTTDVQAHLCLCLDHSDILALMQNQGGVIEIFIPNDGDLTENDPFDDDELGVGLPAGTYTLPASSFTPANACPPMSNEVCQPIPGTTVTVNDSDYESEDPADWEYFEEGNGHWGSTVSIPGGSTMPPQFPNNNA